MSLDAVHALIADLGASMGLEELRPDEEGRVNLMFDDIPVSIEASSREGSVSIYSLIDQLPADMNCGNLHARLLDANYIHRETDGATLGVDAATRNVVLIREENLAVMSPGLFAACLERFINLAEHWRRVVYEAYQESDAPPPDAEPQPLTTPFTGTKV